ncbi:COMM domain-containing protein 10 isoform X1 [Aquarana catesbeiana]|uniref:COMM domain-containing protein 10 isoform X1 n=1 Tax=Aquarana catesbeiana TaxID=8400 RepID=UPI003CCA249B
MATAIVKESASIKQAVSIMNEMDEAKFPRLLSRILQKLHLKAEQSFSEEEEEKLQAAFSLDKQNLKLVLETISFILEQAVYHNLKALVLRQQLENIHLDPNKIQSFVIAWESAGQETVEKFRQRILTPKKLETTAWQLNLQMAQSTQAKMKSPQAVLELGVSAEDTKQKIVTQQVKKENDPSEPRMNNRPGYHRPTVIHVRHNEHSEGVRLADIILTVMYLNGYKDYSTD